VDLLFVVLGDPTDRMEVVVFAATKGLIAVTAVVLGRAVHHRIQEAPKNLEQTQQDPYETEGRYQQQEHYQSHPQHQSPPPRTLSARFDDSFGPPVEVMAV
jgi:hypothetical protein